MTFLLAGLVQIPRIFFGDRHSFAKAIRMSAFFRPSPAVVPGPALPVQCSCRPLVLATGRHFATAHPRPFGNRKIRKGLPVLPPKMSVKVQAITTPPEAGNGTRTSFAALGLSAPLQEAMKEMEIETPTEIQALSFRKILQGGDHIIASHTGSGKTLAYLLPIVQALKREEEVNDFVGRPRRPRAVVLGPTRELTDQIFRVCKKLSHTAKFRSGLLNAGQPRKLQKAQLERPVDILVATPKGLWQHMEEGNLFIGDARFFVLDEADTMFDRGFGPEVAKILGPMKKKEPAASTVLVSATMTQRVQRLITEQIPQAKSIQTATLHKAIAGSQHEFLQVPPMSDKLIMLRNVVQSSSGRTMVFCNTQGSCRAVDHYLSEEGIPALCYHGEMPREARKESMELFMAAGRSSASPSSSSPAPPPGTLPPAARRAVARSASPTSTGAGAVRGAQVMVCTDLAARGLDIPGRVDTVVNFDFPLNPIDYLHRTGRTARAGASGRVVSLVGKKDKVLAARIEDALGKGEALDELSADKRVLPPKMRPKPETIQKRKEEERRLRGRGVRGAARVEMMKERQSKTAGERERKLKARQKARRKRSQRG